MVGMWVDVGFYSGEIGDVIIFVLGGRLDC